MYIRKLFSAFLVFPLLSANAQTNHLSAPFSFRYFENTPADIVTKTMPQDKINQLDKTNLGGKNGTHPVIARSISTDFDIITSSESRAVGNKIVYFYQLKASGAQGLISYFDNFYLGYGSALYIYSPDRTSISTLTHRDNNGTTFNASDIVYGDEIVFEYVPGENAENDHLHISEIGYGFNLRADGATGSSASRATDPMFGTSSSCEVNVNCSPEGDDWQADKQAIVRILVKSGSESGYCSGTLVNNTAQDCTPYILTAEHCQLNESTGANAALSDYNFWKFYFNFESPTCADPAASTSGALASQTITGSTRLAFSNDNGGETGSDFLLLKISKRPDTMYTVYFAGWDATTNVPQSGKGIHHPSGDIKKISEFDNSATSASMYGNVAGTHWKVKWSATQNGHGVTEPGSSGSPIFDISTHRVVGTLTGGGSSCTSLNQSDFYGKVAFHWTSNGSVDSLQLQPWLDLGGTGATAIDGQYAMYIDSNYTCGIPAPPSGIKELSNVDFSIMPNPNNGVFTIQCRETVTTVNIFDINGRLLRTFNNSTSITISDFAKGIYIAQIVTKHGTAQTKVIVE